MSSFEIVRQSLPSACVVRLEGDIDTAVVPELREGLRPVVEGGCGLIVLDLTDVVYADSSALGLLVWLDHRLAPMGGRLVLAGANADIGRILELSGLISVARSLSMSLDVEAALAGLVLSEKPATLLWHEGIVMGSKVDNLASVRERAIELIEPLGFAESALFDIKVALGEALANAVRHGSPSESCGLVNVGISAYDDRVVLEVEDSGSGFDGKPASPDDVYAPSGRGVMFMRALMDRVEFERPQGGGTCVRLVKHRSVVAG